MFASVRERGVSHDKRFKRSILRPRKSHNERRVAERHRSLEACLWTDVWGDTSPRRIWWKFRKIKMNYVSP